MTTIDAPALIARLERFPLVLRTAAGIASSADARWKPAPEHWSILEICAHLLDEEREDFRVRLRSTIDDPNRPWPPLDLEGIALRRRYNEWDLAATLDAFDLERRQSVAWIREQPPSVWSLAHQHPRVGPVLAGELLASWAAHDALHLRQIAKRLHGLAARDAGGCSIRYAGEWTA